MKTLKRALALASAVLLLALAFVASPISVAPQPVQAASNGVPGRYIVVLKSGVDPASAAGSMGRSGGFQADMVFRHAVRGFAANMSDAQARALARDPSVALVEQDQVMSVDTQTVPTGVDRIDTEQNATANITNQLPGTQLDIDIAVIDTGIDTSLSELNVAGGVGFVGNTGKARLNCPSGPYVDDYGHGTHVAGTIGARDNDTGVVGVAPGARLWAVKVLDSTGSGYNSCVIQGVDWVTGRRAEYNDGPGDGDPGINIQVANMSLGGSSSSALCSAISNSVAAGVIYAVAAGNAAQDAAGSSPANCSPAIAVSAFADFDGLPGGLTDTTIHFSICSQTQDDYFACFSNYGSVVDIAAPGVNIVSTYLGGGYGPMSGTSMATPHVAGALALFKLATGYSGSAAAGSVMPAFTAAGYTVPQNSACGFEGGRSGEPVLYVGTDCGGSTSQPTPSPSPAPTPPPDSDGDGVADAVDNCPLWPNASQAIPNWLIPSGDSDCDGYPDSAPGQPWTFRGPESLIGTDATKHCPATAVPNDEPTPDVWPPDFNDDQTVNVSDWLSFNPHLYSSPPQPAYNVRWDLNGDGTINLSDLLQLNPFMFKSCSS